MLVDDGETIGDEEGEEAEDEGEEGDEPDGADNHAGSVLQTYFYCGKRHVSW